MPSAAVALRTLDADQEAFNVLVAEAEGHTGKIPAAVLVEHILRVTSGGDFPLRRAALEAVLRRFKAMKESNDSWSVAARPRSRTGLGLHRIAVAKGKSYRVLISSPGDLGGSCDCADFSRSALGLCKHLWWLFERSFDDTGVALSGTLARPPLSWNSVRPLTGAGDWLDNVFWAAGEIPSELKARFELRNGTAVLKSVFSDAPDKRLKLIRALSRWAQGGSAAEVRAEPALDRLLEEEEETLERNLSGVTQEKELKKALASLRRPLFPYQEEGVTRFLRAGRLLLADDMGLGKTAQAIASCHVLHTTKRVTRGLVIVPAALKSQWLREWKLFTPVPATIVEGGPAERSRLYRETKAGFLLLNYEQVLKDLPELMRFAPQMVVLDEAQRIKNWAAKTSLYVKQLKPQWRLVLSGTPLENRLTELASLMEWVDDRALEPKWRLPEWHAVRADGARDVVGARNLDTLRARLSGGMMRRVRKEVLSQLPPRTDTHVPVVMTEEQLAAHRELDQPVARLVQTSKRRPLTQPEFLRLMSLMSQQRIICNGLAQRDFEQTAPALTQRPSEAALRGLFSPKLLEFRELISNLVVTQSRKVVVFSQWKRMLRLAEWAVSDILADAGCRAVYFTGDESQKRRTQNVVDFHDDGRTRVFFATDAGGVGLNLQRAASACVHLDLPWNPAVMEQRSGRIYRLGQTNPVEVYALVSASGIESRIASIVGSKKAFFQGLFDGATDAVQFEQGGSFMTNLQEVLSPDLPVVPEDDERQDATEELSEEEAIDVAAPVDTPPALAPTAPATEWMTGIKVQRMEDGRMVLEAKPEAAAAFAAMLEGVASLLKQVAPGSGAR